MAQVVLEYNLFVHLLVDLLFFHVYFVRKNGGLP